MLNLSVGAAALNQVPIDYDGNRARILAAIAAARAAGVQLLVLPELAVTGYGCEDYFFASDTVASAWDSLARIVPSTSGMLVAVGLPVRAFGALYNTVALMADGRLVALIPKQNLAADGVHYEARWFKPWPAGELYSLVSPLGEVPFGDLVLDLGGVRIGLEICEDAWVADRPGVSLARRGVDVILNPSASHFAWGKSQVRQCFVAEGSRAFQAVYLYANLLGDEAGRIIYDGEAMIATGGTVVARAERFSFREWTLTSARCDVEVNRLARAQSVSFRPVPMEGEVRLDFSWRDAGPGRPGATRYPWEADPELQRFEEFARAVALALFDYLRKSRSQGFVLSLSGGADSSAVAALVALMVTLGVRELGADAFKSRLGYIGALRDAATDGELVGRLLTCIYQATRNSSDASLAAARALADEIGARFHYWEIDVAVALYRGLAEQVTGALDWERHDLPLQNVQARARVPALWMVANVQGALLLTTSNRSEIAVGYATMDGDSAGSLAPLAGVSKSWIRNWLRWLAQEGPGVAFASLGRVLALTPSAELRPAGSDQADEDDLMPYPVLDAIEREAIVHKRAPAAVLAQVRHEFPVYDDSTMRGWVVRFFRLWSRNQWKRERFAPGFHIDTEDLDPRAWCRAPILSGGFEAQLRELES